jgi:hypothetical protein
MARGTAIIAFLALVGSFLSAGAQTSVLTQHNDLSRTGAVLTETTLKPANVRPGQFGKLFTRKVKGQIYAQPLVVPQLMINGKRRNVVFVATMGDHLYAFDADDPDATQPLWERNFTNPPAVTTIPYRNLVGWADIEPEVGILSTPVIDPDTNTMYVVVRTLEGNPDLDSSYRQRLYAIDIATGNNRPAGPVELQGSVPGTGDQTNGQGQVIYNGRRQNQRPALTLSRGRIYIASASHGDVRPYHGWILSYDAATLAYLGAHNSTPNAGLGGYWMSGQGPAVDANGNLYVVTGNAEYDPSRGSYGDSVLKLSPDLRVLDHFAPYNEEDLEIWDIDLGSTGVLLVPGTNLAVIGSKEGKIYVLDRNAMGGKNPSGDTQIVQWFMGGHGHIHGSPVYFDAPTGRYMYVWSEMDVLHCFRYLPNENRFDPDPAHMGQVVAPDGMPGAFLSVSANGKQNGLIWASLPLTGNANQSIVPGVLRAFDAETLEETWNSRVDAAADHVGLFAKFCAPTVANGKVYMATFSDELAVYGLLPATPPGRVTTVRAAPGEGRIRLEWNAIPRASSYDVLRESDNEPVKPLKRSIVGNTFTDLTPVPGKTYRYYVRGRNVHGVGKASDPISAVALDETTLITIRCIADAHVMTGSRQDDNFGNTTSLVLDGNTVSTTRYGFLKFGLQNVKGEVLQAVVRIHGYRQGPNASRESLFATDADWQETAITWNNKPQFGRLLGTREVNEVPKYIEWDVTAYLKELQAAKSPEAAFGLAMEPRSKEEPNFWNGRRIVDLFRSREAGTLTPELVVTARPRIDYPNGFAGAARMVFYGSGRLDGSRVSLTDLNYGETGGAYYRSLMQVGRFATRFQFQMRNADADGFCFVIRERTSPPLGPTGGGLGYGNDQPGTGGIPRSIAVKFDIYDNAGEGRNSVGIYLNGASPTVPATSLDGTGVDLRSGHVMEADITYDGETLTLRIRDTETGAVASVSYAVDVPGTLDSPLGYVGFTGATGGLTADIDILTWVYGI